MMVSSVATVPSLAGYYCKDIAPFYGASQIVTYRQRVPDQSSETQCFSSSSSALFPSQEKEGRKFFTMQNDDAGMTIW